MTFSIIIPTRQRHDTLKYAIQSVLNQTYRDFELIIMDNFSTSETAEVTFSFGDDRIKYYRAPQRLSMVENWELALSYATGDYICFIGDDDGLMPDGLAIGQQLIQHYNTQAIVWDSPRYHWSSIITPWLRNILSISLTQAAPQVCDSRQFLGRVYGMVNDYMYSPKLYHGLVHRSIIDKVKSINGGKYFLNFCLAPDVYSGIVNAYYSESYLFSYRPLSISGASGHSTGMSGFFPSYNSKAFDTFLQEQNKNISTEVIHPRLIPSQNVFICMASDLSYIKDTFFPDDIEIQLNIRLLIQQMLSPDSSDPITRNIQEDVIKLARKYGIAESEINLPEPITELFMPERAYHGPVRDGNGSVVSLRINCQLAGINNVAQAAKLAWGILEGETIINSDPFELLNQELVSRNLSITQINQFLETALQCPNVFTNNEEFINYLRRARKQAANCWFVADLELISGDYASEVGKTHTILLTTGIKDEPLTEEEQYFLEDIATCVTNRGFNHPSFLRYFLILMLYYYPHQFPQGWYEGVSIPEWFMNEFLKFLLVNPSNFSDQYDAENYYNYALGLVNYLYEKITTNQNSPVWQNISKFVGENANFYLLNDSGRDLSQVQQQLQEICGGYK